MDVNFYLVKECFVDGFDKDNKDVVMFVDIGGNVGYDLEEFGWKYFEVLGRFVF